MSWYQKAAAQGFAAAQDNIGFMYEFGHGVRRDYAEAMTWYSKAAEQGDTAAQTHLEAIRRRASWAALSSTEKLRQCEAKCQPAKSSCHGDNFDRGAAIMGMGGTDMSSLMLGDFMADDCDAKLRSCIGSCEASGN